jgi:hypothetical protein
VTAFNDIRRQLHIIEGAYDEAINVVQYIHTTIQSIENILDEAGIHRQYNGRNLLLDERVALLAQRKEESCVATN